MDFGDLLNINSSTVVVIAVLLFLLVRRSLQWPENIPPGPPAYPVVGNLPLMRQGDVMETFRKLRKQYGDVFSLKLGSDLTVVINGADTLKDAFVKHADQFSDRSSTLMLNLLREKGLLASSGEYWKRTRTFAIAALREFGFGKKSLETRVLEEVEVYLEALDNQRGEPYDIKQTTSIAISNIICSIVFGNRYEYSDKRFHRLMFLLNENLRLNSVSGAINLMPWLRHVPGDLFSYKALVNSIEQLRLFAQDHVAEHRRTFDEHNVNDVIDAFLKQQSKVKLDEEDTIFEDLNLEMMIINLFVAGTETVATTIRWAVLFLLYNPDVQTRLRQEVHTVVGTSRFPSLADKREMPYYDAFITEVLRVGNISPLSVPHAARADIQFRGMTIPKGASIIPNLDSVMTDPELFEDPEKFNPDRFLGTDGKLTGKEKTVMAFSYGRRICLGESLARLELFMFMTSLVQRFELLPEDPAHLPSMEPVEGVARSPAEFKFRAAKIK